MKECKQCKETKAIHLFHKQPTCKNGISSKCKVCFNKQTLEGKNQKRYGLSTAETVEFKKAGCELCGTLKNLHIDHNHETNKIRGCLCTNCNRGLGHFQDSSELLIKAAQYLEKKGSYNKWLS